MHRFNFNLIAVLFVLLSIAANAQNALVQFVNNCPDQIARTADFWCNDQIVDNINFRTSSPFIEIPSESEVRIGLAPGSSTSSSEAFSWWQIRFDAGKRYIVVANGVRNPPDYLPNPTGASIELSVLPIPDVPATAADGSVNAMFLHGVTDAPAIDVTTGSLTIAQALAYGTSTPFLTIPAVEYTLTLSPTGGQPLMAFKANVTPFNGHSILLVTSGFLVPVANQNGSPFGLFIVPDQGGSFIPLQQTGIPTTATVQFVHNAADPSLSSVDLYVSTKKVQDDFAFRYATPFIQVPANSAIPLSVALSGSTSSDDAILTQTVTLPPGRYVIVMNGLRDTTQFTPNPDASSASTALSLWQIAGIQPAAVNPTGLDIIYVNGCTDCAPVNINQASSRAVSSLQYGKASSYVSLEAGVTQVSVELLNGMKLLNVSADISSLAGQAAVVLMSGFANPLENSNGQPLGLWVAKQQGGQLQELSTVTNVQAYDEAGIQFSPNPATTFVRITGLESTVSTIDIVDMMGRTVVTLQPTHTEMTIDVAGLASGLYAVRYTKTDHQSETRLILISR